MASLGYAPNYAGLGRTWLTQAKAGVAIDWREGIARAQPPFDRALRLQPRSAESLCAQAVLHHKLLRFDEARH